MSAQTDLLTRTYRRDSLGLRAVTLRDLQRLWPRLDLEERSTLPAYIAAVALLLQRDRGRSAAQAATYLRAFRSASEVDGVAPIVLAAAAVEAERLDTSMTVTSIVAYRKALGTGVTPERAAAIAFVQSAGTVSRLMLEGGRTTIRDSLAQDTRAMGWRRVTRPGACDWCLMLADRGAVYSAKSAGFSAHDHCACSIEPAYGGGRQAVRPYEPMDRRLSEDTRRRNRRRAKKWIKAHRERLRAEAAQAAA